MIVDKLINSNINDHSRMSNGILRMSLLEGCPRKEAYEYLGYKHDIQFPSGPMYEGNIHEAAVVSLLQAQGFRIWNYGKDQTFGIVEARGLKFRGHPDLFIEVNRKNYGLEIKSTRDEVWDKYARGAVKISEGHYIQPDYTIFMSRPWPYMGQLQMYLHSDISERQNIEEWILIVKSRGSGEYLECIIPKLDEYTQQLAQKWKPFWPLVQAGRLPERFFADDSSECEHCQFQMTCWGVLRKLPKETVEDPSLIKAAEFRRMGVKIKKESEDLLDEARRLFLNSHIRNEADRITCDGLTSTASPRTRKGLDSSKVESLLQKIYSKDPDAIHEFYKVTEYEELRFKDEHSRFEK